MTFLKKHSLGTTIFLLAATCLGLYFFLAKPMVVRRQEVAKALEEKLVQLQKHRDDPPSPEMVDRLSQEKERLEKQHKEMIKALNFVEWVSLPEDTGDPLFLDEQIEEFERQIEKAEDELGRLAEGTGINLPERLGFRRERPENREELIILSSQLFLVRELITLIMKTGVSELSFLNLFSPVTQLEGFEELGFELGIRAEISALTSFLHQIANHPYFFTVKDLEIRPVAARRERILPEVREQEGRRRRRVPPELEALPEIEPEGEEELAEEVGRKLEARILVSTRLPPFPEEKEGEDEES